jgi:hypothetical protein
LRRKEAGLCQSIGKLILFVGTNNEEEDEEESEEMMEVKEEEDEKEDEELFCSLRTSSTEEKGVERKESMF